MVTQKSNRLVPGLGGAYIQLFRKIS